MSDKFERELAHRVDIAAMAHCHKLRNLEKAAGAGGFLARKCMEMRAFLGVRTKDRKAAMAEPLP